MTVLKIMAAVVLALFVLIPISMAILGLVGGGFQQWRERRRANRSGPGSS